MAQPDNTEREGSRPPAASAADERLRLILRNIPDYAIFTIDAGGIETEWPEGAERVKGWKPEEIIGQHVSMFYTPEDRAAERRSARRDRSAYRER